MLNKHNLTVAQFASKEANRYTMNGILVTPDATVATNGHYLVWCGTEPERESEDYPQIEGFKGASDAFKPFVLDRDAALAIAKVTPSKENIPILNHVAVSEDGSQIAVTDLDRPQVFPVRGMTGKFPQYEQVIPKLEDAVFAISVDASYLAQIARQFAGFVSDERNHRVTLSFYADSLKSDEPTATVGRDVSGHPIRFDGVRDGQGMTAVLMPIRDHEDQKGTYGWAGRQMLRDWQDAIVEDAEREERLAEVGAEAREKATEEVTANAGALLDREAEASVRLDRDSTQVVQS